MFATHINDYVIKKTYLSKGLVSQSCGPSLARGTLLARLPMPDVNQTLSRPYTYVKECYFFCHFTCTARFVNCKKKYERILSRMHGDYKRRKCLK